MSLSHSQRIGYVFLRTLLRLLACLPLDVLYLLGDIACPFVHRFYRREIVRKNLQEAFPEKCKEELQKIESDFYHDLCDMFIEVVKQFSMSKEQMMRRMTFSGLDKMHQDFDSGKTLSMCYLGHYGNWEWIASLQYWMPGMSCSQVYHPLYNKMSDELFLQIRNQYGGECIPMKLTVRRLLEMRAEGKKVVCGMIADQLPKWNAIHHFTPFLNHDTAVFIGTEQLAKRLDATVYYGRVTCSRRGYYHCEWIRMTDQPTTFADYDLTDRYMQLLEHDIVQHPEQWLWTHKRWRRTKEDWLQRQAVAVQK